MIRWGILGAGNIARRFAKSLEKSPDGMLYAAAFRSEEKAKRFAEEYTLEKVYTSYDDLIKDEAVDAVYLSLPHGLHAAWAIKALSAGKALLCEKPAALNAGEVRQIAQAAKDNGVLFMEAMKPRFVPLYGKFMEIIRSGAIGEIQRIETSLCNLFSFDKDHPTYHTELGQGGALLDEGIYCASFLQEFFGVPIQAKRLAGSIREGVDYYIDTELVFDNHKTGKLECAFDRQKPRTATFYGEKGKIILEDFHRPQEMKVCIYGKEPEHFMVPYEVDDFYGEISHFSRCYAEGKKESDIMPLSASIECAQILDFVRSSMRLREESLAALKQQEGILRYEKGFGSREALALGNAVAGLAEEYDRGISAAIIREKDGMVMFEYAMDDKAPRNVDFMLGKRRAALSCGHASLWAYIEHELSGKWEEIFQKIPDFLPAGGAFPIRAGDTWVATLLVSGLHEGLDHELAVRALAKTLGKEVPQVIGVVV